MCRNEQTVIAHDTYEDEYCIIGARENWLRLDQIKIVFLFWEETGLSWFYLFFFIFGTQSLTSPNACYYF